MKRLLLTIALLTTLTACDDEQRKPLTPKYSVGETVTMVVDGRRVTVLNYYETSIKRSPVMRYEVRIPVVMLDTNSRILSKDAPISTQPYTTQYVYEFELQKIPQ